MSAQSFMIKTINTIFRDTWNGIYCHLISPEEGPSGPYISLKYSPGRGDYQYFGDGDNGIKVQGTLRVFIYQTNQTTSMETYDQVIDFLRNKRISGLYFTEGFSQTSAVRQENGELFTSFIDFDVCKI